MPLAHLLAPQLLKKAKEIEADLGYAPVGAPQGYLQTVGAGSPSTGEMKPYNPNTPSGAMIGMAGALQKSLGPAAAAGFWGKKGADLGLDKSGDNLVRGHEPTLIPNAPLHGAVARTAPAQKILMPNGRTVAIAPGDVTDELGRPVSVMPPPVPFAQRKGPIVITLPAGEAVAENERGESLNRRGGRRLGYLPGEKQPAHKEGDPYFPQVLAPGMRTGDYRDSDISIADAERNPKPFDVAAMRRMYGKDLKAMQENRDADGMPTDQFPPGYFRGMSEKDRANIEAGTRALMNIERELDLSRAKGRRT